MLYFSHKRIYQTTITSIAVVWALFHLYTAYSGLLPALQQRSIHLLFAMLLIFLTHTFNRKENERLSIEKVFFAALVIWVIGYVIVNHIEIWTQTSKITTYQEIVSLLAIFLILEGTRRTIGISLPILGLAFIAYAYFGNFFPGILRHKGYSVSEILRYQVMSIEGIFGIALGVVASFVYLYILYASVLNSSGGGQVFIHLATGLVGKIRGGPAKIAVVASALFGSISGSAVANAASTGAFTIPLMKRTGYSSRFAAAVEAVASSGGQFMPPVMGAAAFLIAEILAIPFWQVVISAAVPGALYFLAIFIMVDIEAAKQGIQGLKEEEVPRLKETLLKGWHLMLSPLVLIYLLLFLQISPMHSAFWAILVTIASTFINKHNRMSLFQIIDSMKKASLGAIETTIACASIGIVIGVIMQTGAGFSIASMLVSLSGGSLLLLLILTMVSSLVLGMGLPTVAAYLVLATMVAPALIDLGVNELAAHLFIFYFGIISAITPPVALASLVTSGLANSKPLPTSLTAMRLGLSAYLLPFMFVFGPALILEGSVTEVIISICTAIVGIYSLSVGLQKYFMRSLNVFESGVFVAIALSLIHPNYITDVIGVILLTLISGFIYIREKKAKDLSVSSEG